MRIIAIAAAACGLLVLGGCGIKGPLYLPQPPKPAANPTERATLDSARTPANTGAQHELATPENTPSV